MKNQFAKIIGFAIVCFCFATNAIANEKVKVVTGAYERIDWQGRATGSDIPKWVLAVSDNNKRTVSKELDLGDYMIWTFNANGDDLEFLSTWTDKVELQSNVAQSISSEIGRATQATLEETKADIGSEKAQQLKDVTTALSNVRVNGLERIASYWIKSRAPKVKKPKKDSDYEVLYTYYSVWAMEKDLYQKQLEAAAKNVDQNTSQDPLLMKIITASIAKTILDDLDVKSETLYPGA